MFLLPFTVWTIAGLIKARPSNSLTEICLLQRFPRPRSLSAHFTATAVWKTNLLSAWVFLTGYPADTLVLEVQERPSLSCAPLPPSRSAKWIYCHCWNFCQFSKGERGDGLRESNMGLLRHAVSPTQRAFEISSLVNGCSTKTWGEQRLAVPELPNLAFVECWNSYFHNHVVALKKQFYI